MLNAKQLSVAVGAKKLLNEVNFSLSPGELAVVLGPNGAGKSTLLKALCGDVNLQAGEVRYHDKPLLQYSAQALSRMRAVLTQQYDCEFPFSVQEIVDMSHFVHQHQISPTRLKQFSLQALETLSVAHLAKRSFTQLSGGEKQRVQFARVLCQLLPTLEQQQPCYLMIDEPTASLDLFHQYQVMALAKNIAKQGAGVVAVVHDLALAASFADTVYLLQRGELVAAGAPNTVLAKQQLKHTYGIDAELTQVGDFLPALGVARSFDLRAAQL